MGAILSGRCNMAKGKRKIGILGGTFNPIHIGHIQMARIALKAKVCEEVWFMPDGMPPHKTVSGVTSQQRLEMTRLAVLNEKKMSVLSQEIDRGGYTYTVDTMRWLSEMYPDTQFIQIIGADTLMDLENWKDFDVVAFLCSFYVIQRIGTDPERAQLQAEKLEKAHRAKIRFAKEKCMDISSTRLRMMILNDLEWKQYVPQWTAAYIEENELYQEEEKALFDQIADDVRGRMPLQRWRHVLGVVQTAEELAKRYGADVERTRIAALLHDCAKGYRGKEALDYMKQYGVALDAFTKQAPKLWHGPLGAAIAEKEYGITDEEILNAIRVHTIGAPEMTKLEKIVKLADLTEPGRTYVGVTKIRELAKKDLDQALLEAMKNTSGYLKGGNQSMHPDSAAAIRALEKKIGGNTDET